MIFRAGWVLEVFAVIALVAEFVVRFRLIGIEKSKLWKWLIIRGVCDGAALRLCGWGPELELWATKARAARP